MSLEIQLTHPVVFLPPIQEIDENAQLAPPVILRGLLILHLSKSTRILGINVKLASKATTAWPPGTRVDGQLLPDTEQAILFCEEKCVDQGYAVDPTLENIARGSPVGASVEHQRSTEVTCVHSETGYNKAGTSLICMLENVFKQDASTSNGRLYERGTYTFPIAFEVPADAAETVTPGGQSASITWWITASAHRLGRFTPKLSATEEILVVRTPEETYRRPLYVDNQWDNQLLYEISVPQTHLVVGPDAHSLPLTMVLTPLDKIKIHSISIAIEEHVTFYSLNTHRVVRHAPPRRNQLLVLHNRENRRLLPPDPVNHPEDLFKADEYDLVGPWVVRVNVPLPKSCYIINESHEHKKSNLKIAHILQVVFRAQRGDGTNAPPKLYDVAVDIPIHMISCRFWPKWADLPLYSCEDPKHCPCELHEGSPPGNADWHGWDLSDEEQLARHRQFERLVSGQEDVLGGCPPPYGPR